jgi:hypothetical protein
MRVGKLSAIAVILATSAQRRLLPDPSATPAPLIANALPS